jgi:hypothetical protein
MIYHDPVSYELWNSGIIEDYESSTGVFITAKNEIEAIAWGEQIAQKLFERLNPWEINAWKSFGYTCWLIEDEKTSYWKHCLDFFQSVDAHEIPDFEKMGADAYVKWQLEKGMIDQEEFDAHEVRKSMFAEWMEKRR